MHCSHTRGGGGKNRGVEDAGEHPVVLFDGVCNLCNGAVGWIIRRDPGGVFKFAALQSRSGFPLESIVLLEGGREYRRSTAFLRVLRRLPRLKWLAYFGAVIPERIRDEVYDLIARKRYAWFGKREQCALVDPLRRVEV